MSNKDTGTEVSNTPYLDPDKAIKMTEETYPPVGFRIFSQEGVGERPHAKKADLKAEVSKTTAKKSAGSRAGTTSKEK